MEVATSFFEFQKTETTDCELKRVYFSLSRLLIVNWIKGSGQFEIFKKSIFFVCFKQFQVLENKIQKALKRLILGYDSKSATDTE